LKYGVGPQRETNKNGNGHHHSKSHGGPEKHHHGTFLSGNISARQSSGNFA